MGDKIRNKWQDESLESKCDEEENIVPANTKRKTHVRTCGFGRLIQTKLEMQYSKRELISTTNRPKPICSKISLMEGRKVELCFERVALGANIPIHNTKR